MTEDSGIMSIDFLVGFTIFLITFIWVATLIPGLFIGLQSHTIDYDAVAYRAGVILVEDPGAVGPLVTYDRSGEKVNTWLGWYPEKEIIISEIITPRELFKKNREQIFPTPHAITTESRELALAEGSYYLTITGQGKTRHLVFDAKTGALTSSND